MTKEAAGAFRVKVPGFTTVSLKVAVCTSPLPPSPVTVTVLVPAAVLEGRVSTRLLLPVGVTEAGLKAAVAPAGRPLALKLTVRVKPRREATLIGTVKALVPLARPVRSAV